MFGGAWAGLPGRRRAKGSLAGVELAHRRNVGSTNYPPLCSAHAESKRHRCLAGADYERITLCPVSSDLTWARNVSLGCFAVTRRVGRRNSGCGAASSWLGGISER